MQKKYIITGAPGTGKSTLIEALENQGILCLKEISRQIIISEQNQGNDGMPWENIERFTELVFAKTKESLHASPQSVFCDRSLVDSLAYIKHKKKSIPDYLEHFSFQKYYHKTVFFAQPWKAIYKNDPQRPEDFEAQLLLSSQLEKTYNYLGFNLVVLPFVSVESRVAFVLEKLNSGV